MSSSRFVSAGNSDPANDKEDAWQKAQEAIEASKKRTEEATTGRGLQEGGKTLFEVLQANKVAKQEAFEESLRLKNQVQFFNEEDAEYLESLSKNERAQKAATEKEAREQLAAFRRQQEDVEKAATAGDQIGDSKEEGETWAISAKKRKKAKEHDLIKGVKLRKTSSTDKAEAEVAKIAINNSKKANVTEDIGGTEQTKQGQAKSASPAKDIPKPSHAKAASPVALGLGAYSSDEDD